MYIQSVVRFIIEYDVWFLVMGIVRNLHSFTFTIQITRCRIVWTFTPLILPRIRCANVLLKASSICLMTIISWYVHFVLHEIGYKTLVSRSFN
ncbi:unnamed protein product [Linum trigynum]|uniref:Uncharacterized protein n=1 Tax=Linum trigynum TaxID=586398 RepID=A0AAV2EFF5_9ROSI